MLFIFLASFCFFLIASTMLQECANNISANNQYDEKERCRMNRIVDFCQHPLFQSIPETEKRDLIFAFATSFPTEVRIFFGAYIQAQFQHDMTVDLLNDFECAMHYTFAISAPPTTFQMIRAIETRSFNSFIEMLMHMSTLYKVSSAFRDIVEKLSRLNVADNEDSHLLRVLSKDILKRAYAARGSSFSITDLKLLFRNMSLLATKQEREDVGMIIGNLLELPSLITPSEINEIIKLLTTFAPQERVDICHGLQAAGFFKFNYAYHELIIVLNSLKEIADPVEKKNLLEEFTGIFNFVPEEIALGIDFLAVFDPAKRKVVLASIREMIVHQVGGDASKFPCEIRSEFFVPLFKTLYKWIFEDHDVAGGARLQICFEKIFSVPTKMRLSEYRIIIEKIDNIASTKYPAIYELNGFVTIAMEWTHNGMSGKEIANLLHAFGDKVPNMDVLQNHLSKLLRQIVAPPFCFSADGVALISNIAAIPSLCDQTQIVGLIRSLAEELGFMSTPKLASLVRGLHKTAPDEREVIMRIITKCSRYIRTAVYHNLGIDDVCAIIDILRLVPVSDRESLFADLQPYFEPTMASSTDISVVMSSVRLIPADYRNHFSEFALPFINRPRMTGYEMTSIINALRVRMTEMFAYVNEETLTRAQMIGVVNDELAQIVNLTDLFLKDCRHVRLSGHSIAAIIESIRMIESPEEREFIVSEVVYSTLCPLLQPAYDFHHQEAQPQAPTWQGWVSSDQSLNNISHIINAFRVIPKAEWEGILALVIPLVSRWMNPQEVSQLIYVLQSIPLNERASRVSRALLFQSTVPSISLEYVLEQTLVEPVVVHEDLLYEANLIDGGDDDIEDERGHVMYDEDGDDLRAMIDELDEIGRLPPPLRRRRRRQHGAGAGAAAAAESAPKFVNVHSGTREKRTFEAIEGLLFRAKEVNTGEQFNLFWEAVSRVVPTEKREQILKTLGVHMDLSPQKRGERDFGGLLTSEDGLVNVGANEGGHVLRVNGRLLIALFWHFANTYEGDEEGKGAIEIETERENIRCAIMDGLASGVQQDDDGGEHVVCDMGKLQRLALSLQGRLLLASGSLVDIDGVQKCAKRLRVSAAAAAPNVAPPAAATAAAAAAAPNVLAHHRHMALPPVTFVDQVKAMEPFLRPFVDEICSKTSESRPRCTESFLLSLIEYRNRCAKELPGVSQINTAAMMYFLFLMETHPFSFNPPGSLMKRLSDDLFDDTNTLYIHDYLDQLGAFGRMMTWN